MISGPVSVVLGNGLPPRFYMAPGDTAVPLQVTFLDAGNAPVDLTGGSVMLHVVDAKGLPTITAGLLTLTNPASGQAQYAFQATDITLPGTYQAEFFVTLASGQKFRAPKPVPLLIIASQVLI